MPDDDRDLVQLFVRDLDSIDLPERGRWRPAPRAESALMRTTRHALTGVAVVAVLLLALIASFGLRNNEQVATTSTPLPTATASAAISTPTTPAASAPVLISPSTNGKITGRVGYPSEFVPPMSIFAISVNDPSTWY